MLRGILMELLPILDRFSKGFTFSILSGGEDKPTFSVGVDLMKSEVWFGEPEGGVIHGVWPNLHIDLVSDDKVILRKKADRQHRAYFTLEELRQALADGANQVKLYTPVSRSDEPNPS